MKRFLKENCGNIIAIICIFAMCVAAVVFVVQIVTNRKESNHVHVHLLESNLCYDVKRTWAQDGIVWITFNDNSVVKVGANNVVVYVDHVCDYCGN